MTFRHLQISVLAWGFSVLAVTIVLLTAQASRADNDKTKITEEAKQQQLGSATDSIPDSIAYELFFRIIGEGKPANLLERAGFKQEEAERIVQEAANLNQDLKQADNSARQIISKKNQTAANRNSLLKNITKLKETHIFRAVNIYLNNNLGEGGKNKLQSFIEKDIKPQIQKVSDENAYFIAAGWNEGGKVFGVGSIIGDYEAGNFYRVTVTITSPGSSRTESIQSSWGHSSVTDIAELPIRIQDGVYQIKASFERRIDKNVTGIVLGADSKYLGTSTADALVAPAVNIEGISPATSTLGPGESVTITASVSVTNDVPVGSKVKVELFGTSIPEFTYTVNPGRVKEFTVAEPGTPVAVEFLITITSTTSQGSGTSATNKARVQSVTPPQGSPSVTAGTNTPTVTINLFQTASARRRWNGLFNIFVLEEIRKFHQNSG